MLILIHILCFTSLNLLLDQIKDFILIFEHQVAVGVSAAISELVDCGWHRLWNLEKDVVGHDVMRRLVFHSANIVPQFEHPLKNTSLSNWVMNLISLDINVIVVVLDDIFLPCLKTDGITFHHCVLEKVSWVGWV